MDGQYDSRESKAPSLDGVARWLMRSAQAMAAVVALVGLGHLIAWESGFLTDLGVSVIVTKTNTALCLLLLGLSLLLQIPPQPRPWRRGVALALAAVPMVIGLLSLSENLVGWDLGIDQLLAHEAPGALGVAGPNLMGTPASISFFFAGMALLLLNRRDKRALKVAQGLALAVCLIALLGSIGFLYGATGLYETKRLTGVAWPTAVSLLMLGLSLLCSRPTEGIMAQVTADDPGGTSLRRLLPILLLPIVLGWVRLVGERLAWFNAPTGTALMMIIFIVCLALMAYGAGRRASRAAASLGEQREWLRVTLSSIGDAVLATDTAGRITFFNPVAEKLTGWSKPEAIGRPIGEILRLINEKTRQPADDIVGSVLREGRIVALANHTAVLTREGREIPIEDSAAPIRDAAGSVAGVVLVFHDVTQKRRAQEALRLSEERFRNLFNSLIEGFCIIEMVFDADGRPVDYRFLEINPSFEAQTGLLNAQGKLMRELAPDHEKQWFDIYGRIALTGKPEHFVNEARALNRWYDVRAYRLGGQESRKVAILFNDITERRQAEAARERLMNELEIKNRELEEFAHAVSHDLKAPLRAVTSLSDLLVTDYSSALEAEGQATLRLLKSRVQRMYHLIEGVLEYSRLGRVEGAQTCTDLQTVVECAVDLVCPPDDFTVIVEPGLPTIVCDPMRMQQVFQNLIGNAVRHRERPQGEVRIGCVPDDGGFKFFVRDNGPGIDEQHHERIFKMFQTLKSKDETGSTGIGLSIVRRIVENVGGRVWVESALGQGSTFYFTIPQVKAAT